MADAATSASAAGALRPFAMPSLGADMEAGTILAWRVAPGDRVKRGDIVADVETEKAEMEVEIFDDGVIAQILVAIGEKVAVGTPLALIAPARAAAAAPTERPIPTPTPFPSERAAPRSAEATQPPTLREAVVRAPEPKSRPEALARAQAMPERMSPAAPPPPADPAARPPLAAARDATSPRARIHATPLARRLAESLGVRLELITGSGPGGAVTADDVRAHAAAPKPASAAPREEPARATPAPRAASAGPAAREVSRQRVIAALMERSKREIPHYYLSASLDFSAALAWLEARNRERPLAERVLPAALLLRAVALAVCEAPELNGHYVGGEFRPAPALHLGVAIALRGGALLAPAILDAGAKDLAELMRALRDVGERARTGKLRTSEMSSATLTVTSLGERGVDSVQAVIYPPQVAIVGFGTPALRPWVDREGGLCARTIVQATLAADHRVSNGHRGALFLAAIGRALLAPQELA